MNLWQDAVIYMYYFNSVLLMTIKMSLFADDGCELKW